MSLANFSSPLRVTITIPINVATFGGVGFAASALGQIEKAHRELNVREARFRFDGGRPYRLRHFRVNSPPEASVLSDPSWLAVYIALLALGVSLLQLVAAYPKLKGGIRELLSDASAVRNLANGELENLVSAISGLSEQRLIDLRLGASLYLEELLRHGTNLEALFQRAMRLANTLGARGNKRPTVVAEEDSNNED